MTFRIFPTSPLPANFGRKVDWRESGTEYDSGMGQATSPLTKPLYQFSFTHTNAPRVQQKALEDFYNNGKARVTPFWIKDPYDFADDSDGRTIVRTGQVDPSTMFFRNSNSYHYWPDSATFSGWLTSNTSGTLIFGTDYLLDQETGILTFSLQVDSNDFFTVANTVSYFKKCVFSSPLQNASPRVWEQFNIRVDMTERTR
ncbi:MAG: hypothetical protein V3S55_03825 [Nitrospiraceae bacterium]